MCNECVKWKILKRLLVFLQNMLYSILFVFTYFFYTLIERQKLKEIPNMRLVYSCLLKLFICAFKLSGKTIEIKFNLLRFA